MKKSFILLLSVLFGLSCQNETFVPEKEPTVSSVRFKIVDNSYKDLITEQNWSYNKIKIYYIDSLKEHLLNFIIFNYELEGFIVDVEKIPELSSAGIKEYYFKFNDYKTDSLYLDIHRKSNQYNTPEWFNYLEMKCNGIRMEYSERYVFYYIKK